MAPIETIKRCSSLKILGHTFEPTSRFGTHVNVKLVKSNKCLSIRNLRKDGYNLSEIDLFKSLVLSRLTYALSVYAASLSELTAVHDFFTRYKRNYISTNINIYSLLEQSDRTIFNKIRIW